MLRVSRTTHAGAYVDVADIWIHPSREAALRAELARVLAAFAEDGGKEHARGACYACESLGKPMESEIDWLLKRPALVQQGGHA